MIMMPACNQSLAFLVWLCGKTARAKKTSQSRFYPISRTPTTASYNSSRYSIIRASRLAGRKMHKPV